MSYTDFLFLLEILIKDLNLKNNVWLSILKLWETQKDGIGCTMKNMNSLLLYYTMASVYITLCRKNDVQKNLKVEI